MAARHESRRTTSPRKTSPPTRTIAGKGGSEVEAGYSPGEVTIQALVAAVPGLRELAELTGEQIAQIGSQDMNDGLWLRLAARMNAIFAQDAFYRY